MGNFDQNFENYLNTESSSESKGLVPLGINEAFQAAVTDIRINSENDIGSFNDRDFEDDKSKM